MIQANLLEVIDVHGAGNQIGMDGLGMLQGVGDVDDAGEAEFARAAKLRMMVASDGFDERNGQPPKREQIRPDFGMRDVKMFSFNLNQRRAGGLGFVQHGGIFTGQAVSEDDFSDIVQEAGAESQFRQSFKLFRLHGFCRN